MNGEEKTVKLTEADCVYYSDSEFKKPYTIKDAQHKEEGKLKPLKVYPKNDANGFRLPSFIEWIYAAIGGKYKEGTSFDEIGKNSLYKYPGSDTIEEVAWYNKNSNSKTHPVGKKTHNGYGLYDMSGNVSEWCYIKSGNYPINGGSLYASPDYCTVDNILYNSPSGVGNIIGFRLAWTPKEEYISK